MTRFVGLALVFLATASPAQTFIKGHHLGESQTEFLKNDPIIEVLLRSCRDGAPLPLSADQVRALSAADFDRLAENYPNAVTRKKLEQLAASGAVVTVDKRSQAQQAFCESTSSVLEAGKDGWFHSDAVSTQATSSTVGYNFWRGHLSEILINLGDAEYADVEADFSKKCDANPREGQMPKQNALGATWNDRIAIWTTSELHAVLTDNRSPVTPRLSLLVESAELYAFEKAQKAARPSPLN